MIVLDHLSEAQKRAYIIADNQLALNAGWDDEILRAELALLQAEEFNLDLIGFEDRDLAQLLADQDSEDLANIVPDVPPVPITVFGDLWLLGKHRVLCGDSTDGPSVARLLAGAEPFLMVTDPPYGIELDSEWRDRAGLNGCRPAETSYVSADQRAHRDIDFGRHARRLVRRLCAGSQSRSCLRFPRIEIHPRGPRRLAADRIPAPPANHLGQRPAGAHPHPLLVPTRANLVRPEEECPVVWKTRKELNHLGVAFAQVHYGRLG